ncbi:MAG: hypothetical protein LUM44_17745 [Pyrinomonadaceae bacterium]|nr:hypothetical protein [Pyrinomonadaceae bacterium]
MADSGITYRKIDFKMEAADAERVILGAILLDNSIIRQTRKITPLDFTEPFHRAVFSAMLELEENGDRIDALLIFAIIKKQPSYNDPFSMWTVSAITNLTYGLPHFHDIFDYVHLVKENSSRIYGVSKGENLCDQLAAGKITLKEFCHGLVKLESELRDNYAEETDSFKPLSEIFQTEVLPTLDAYFRQEATEFLISTGLDKIDETLGGGLYRTDVLAIVAPPKSAKSALALQIGRNIAKQGETVGLLSLEMSNLQNALRLIAQESYALSFDEFGDDSEAVESNWLKPGIYQSTYEKASQIAAKLFLDNFLVCQKPLEWREVQSEARRLVKEKNLSVLIVDYWQLIENGQRGKTRAELLGEIAKGLKKLGQELNIAIIVLGQFNQEGLKEYKKSGELSPLYLEGSGELVKSANIVLTVDIKEADLNDRRAPRRGTLTFKPLRSGADRRLECEFYGRFLTVTNIYG